MHVKRKKREKPAPIKHAKQWKWFYGITFFTGTVLMVFEIGIFRKTIIPVAIPLSIILGIGMLSYLLLQAHYKKLFHVRGFFCSLIQSTLSFGFIGCYLFMACNYYGTDNERRTYQFKIIDKSSMPATSGNRRSPLVRFNYFGFEKELVFGSNYAERVYYAEDVILTVKKGALGFDVIEAFEVK